MAHKEDLALMAHLMRRTGFGASREELERRVAEGYEATVEELVNPPAVQPGEKAGPMAMVGRYQTSTVAPSGLIILAQANWLYHLINTQRPLEEKMVLFWHQVFATGNSKVDNPDHMLAQINMFRKYSLGNYRELLVGLAKDPAMIFWLDNNENHWYAVNENWGRELLELFSMGVGNYTEEDVREASRAFTGWTNAGKLPRAPYGRFPWHFEYQEADHDDGEKTFLGQTGRFNGEDIIDIVVRDPACARFVCRHLYNFFVADEPQVPAWTIEPARDEAALEFMINTFVDSGYEVKPVLRAMFNSDFFKNARFAKIKSPAEVVAGTLRMVGSYTFPERGLVGVAEEPGYMGQSLLDPPSVEGWHTGHEWINSGSLLARVNFVADRLLNTDLPGVKSIIDRMQANGVSTPEELVDAALEDMGFLKLSDDTREKLLEYLKGGGNLDWSNPEAAGARVAEALALVGATTEYQFA